MTGDTVGDLMRDWRRRRQLSQLDLSTDAEVSTRHLSFVESGRAQASRDLLLRLADRLSMPLRERNRLLVAGGFAPAFSARNFAGPDMTAARSAVQVVLGAYDPFPALAVDRYWTLVLANGSAQQLMHGVASRLLQAPVNVLRLSLDPEGLAPRIVNLAEWRHHILSRLRADATSTGDAGLSELHDELAALPAPRRIAAPAPDRIAVPLQLRAADGEVLSFLSTTTVFGTATDITLSELTLEAFLPADEATRRALMAGVAG